MDTWIRYDALVDIKEDFEDGIILFPREQLDAYNIELVKGEPIPKNLKKMYRDSKRDISAKLFKESKSSRQINLSRLERMGLEVYFLSRILKLNLNHYPFKKEDLV
jgi:hypothetical protein